jgi:hypothetical protein
MSRTEPQVDDPMDGGVDEHHAEHIVAHASRRALGRRPGLQRASAIAWAAFIGAACMMGVGLLLPEDWLTAPVSFSRLAYAFAMSWGLSLIPAIAANLLSPPRCPPATRAQEDEHGAR